MTAETAWKLFACTGLPEAYSFYCRLEQIAEAQAAKGAGGKRAARGCRRAPDFAG